MEVRPYVDADLHAVKAAVAAWVHEAGRCGYCHPGDIEHRIHHESGSQLDAFIWEDGDGVAGVEISGRFDAVFDLFARPALRGTDAERDMLRGAATRCDETDVFACDSTRRALLEELGFECYRSWDHIRMRSLDDVPDLQVPEGFTLADDGTAARATIWLDEVNLVGLFEPVETHEGFRRRGLGRALMVEGLRRMKEAGMRTAIVEHDITNEPAAALYESVGFAVTFDTLGYRRRSP